PHLILATITPGPAGERSAPRPVFFWPRPALHWSRRVPRPPPPTRRIISAFRGLTPAAVSKRVAGPNLETAARGSRRELEEDFRDGFAKLDGWPAGLGRGDGLWLLGRRVAGAAREIQPAQPAISAGAASPRRDARRARADAGARREPHRGAREDGRGPGHHQPEARADRHGEGADGGQPRADAHGARGIQAAGGAARAHQAALRAAARQAEEADRARAQGRNPQQPHG